jgi:hypothetical protein
MLKIGHNAGYGVFRDDRNFIRVEIVQNADGSGSLIRSTRAGVAAVSCLFAVAMLASCSAGSGPENPDAGTGLAQTTGALRPGSDARREAGFSAYWYQGKAEMNVFDLEQARYGEMRNGKAVLIFVTEDFSRKQLVKLDDPGSAGDDAVPVLKLNFTRDFPTGIYAYKTMQSVISPVDRSRDPQALKSTTSVQEWCGHVFMDLHQGPKGYEASVQSYFEGESVQGAALGEVFLEDAVWNLIRLDPAALPTGTFQAVPGSLDIRLRHLPLTPTAAEALLSESEDGKMVYEIRYPERERSLKITFEKEFPRSILAFEETVNSWGKTLTTRAVRSHQVMEDYWTHNSVSDEPMRKALGL